MEGFRHELRKAHDERLHLLGGGGMKKVELTLCHLEVDEVPITADVIQHIRGPDALQGG